MEFTKTKTTIDKREVTALRYPFSTKESVLRIRKEKTCWFCAKKYEDSEYFGGVMTNKGSKICCDDCCKSFEQGGVERVGA